MSDIDLALEKARELDPELWEKIDRIAEIIDPGGAFARWYNGTGPDAEMHPLSTRQKYMQSKARTTAESILKYLGIMPETYDWGRLFRAMYPESFRGPSEPEPSP